MGSFFAVPVVGLLHVVVDEALSRSVIPRIKAMKVLSMDPEDRLFPFGYSVTKTKWKRALLKSGVRYRKPHNLRHAFASIRLSRGANILEVQEAGGWNRFVLEVQDLPTLAARMREAGVPFRNEIVDGPGGRQILCEDPSGNVVELFEPRA